MPPTIATAAAVPGGAQVAPASKRRRLGDAGADSAGADSAAAARARAREVWQRDWGIAEVLAECGAELPAAGGGGLEDLIRGLGGARIPPGVDLSFLGVRLDADVGGPSALAASVRALLGEMDRSGVDPGNGRVLEGLAELLVPVEGGGAGGRHGPLRRMLLPAYRVAAPPPPPGDGDKENHGNLTTVVPEGGEGGGKGGTSPAAGEVQLFGSGSLLRALLRVDVLQPTLVAALLQKLPELALEEEDEEEEGGGKPGGEAPSTASAAATTEDPRLEIPRLILSQIRWLDRIVDPTALTEASLEVLSVLTSAGGEDGGPARAAVLDLIATLPDIADETNSEQMDRIVSTLADVRGEDPALLVPCLDALSSLRLGAEQMAEVAGDALRSLQTADVGSLPALCRFLVQSSPPSLCGEVVEALRDVRLGGTGGLEEEDAGRGVGNSSAGAGAAKGRRGRRRGRGSAGGGDGSTMALGRADAEGLMLEALSQGMQYRPDLAAALLAAVRATEPTQHRPSDVWLLLCCAVAPHNRPAVRAIFRSKATGGGITPDLLRDALRGNGGAMSHLFSPAATDLADGLVRSPEGEARDLGGALYAALFGEFADPMRRGEVVAALATHVASGGSPLEVDAAMKVFADLAEGAAAPVPGALVLSAGRREGTLRPFRPYLASLLDHVRRLTPSQVRRLFLVLFSMGGNDEDGANGDALGGGRRVGTGGCDDVHIVIRKYLSQASVALKRIVRSVCKSSRPCVCICDLCEQAPSSSFLLHHPIFIRLLLDIPLQTGHHWCGRVRRVELVQDRRVRCRWQRCPHRK